MKLEPQMRNKWCARMHGCTLHVHALHKRSCIRICTCVCVPACATPECPNIQRSSCDRCGQQKGAWDAQQQMHYTNCSRPRNVGTDRTPSRFPSDSRSPARGLLLPNLSDNLTPAHSSTRSARACNPIGTKTTIGIGREKFAPPADPTGRFFLSDRHAHLDRAHWSISRTRQPTPVANACDAHGVELMIGPG